jgi:hypothetical protein
MTCRAHPFYAVREQPVKTFHEEKEAEHDSERDVEVIAEDGKCKQRLGDEEPGSVV